MNLGWLPWAYKAGLIFDQVCQTSLLVHDCHTRLPYTMKLIAFSVLITAVTSAQASNRTSLPVTSGDPQANVNKTALHEAQQTTPILPGPTTFAVHYKDSIDEPYAGGNLKREAPAPPSIIWDNNIKRENPRGPGFAPEGDNFYPLPGANSGSPVHGNSEEAGSKGPQTIIWDSNVKRGKPGDPGYKGPDARGVKYPFPGENSGAP